MKPNLFLTSALVVMTGIAIACSSSKETPTPIPTQTSVVVSPSFLEDLPFTIDDEFDPIMPSQFLISYKTPTIAGVQNGIDKPQDYLDHLKQDEGLAAALLEGEIKDVKYATPELITAFANDYVFFLDELNPGSEEFYRKLPHAVDHIMASLDNPVDILPVPTKDGWNFYLLVSKEAFEDSSTSESNADFMNLLKSRIATLEISKTEQIYGVPLYLQGGLQQEYDLVEELIDISLQIKFALEADQKTSERFNNSIMETFASYANLVNCDNLTPTGELMKKIIAAAPFKFSFKEDEIQAKHKMSGSVITVSYELPEGFDCSESDVSNTNALQGVL